MERGCEKQGASTGGDGGVGEAEDSKPPVVRSGPRIPSGRGWEWEFVWPVCPGKREVAVGIASGSIWGGSWVLSRVLSDPVMVSGVH